MIANYHTHSFRCGHAVGTDREYIEKAIEAGFTELGFSDHAPMFFPVPHPTWRMEPESAVDYFESLKALKKEYEKDIKIFIGFESEYYPDLFDGFYEYVKPMGLEFLILGQHALYNENDVNPPVVMRSDKTEHLYQYVRQVIAGLNTGKFTYMAHPDAFHFDLPDELYNSEMIKICLRAKELNIPLELNMLGIRDNRTYPCDRFFNLVEQVGNDVIFGCDAHQPEALLLPENLEQAQRFAEKHHLNVIEKVKIVTP